MGTVVELRPLRRAEEELEAAALLELGLASGRRQNRMRDAEQYLRLAVAKARRTAEADVEVRAGNGLAHVLAAQGRTDDALDTLGAVLVHARGVDLARLHLQHALVLQRAGRHEEALQPMRRSLAAFRRLGDAGGEAELRNNRGVLLAYLGRHAQATAEFERAERLHLSRGQAVLAAETRHNLGFVALRRGDLATALARYEEAADGLAALGVVRPAALLDHAEALLAARLLPEARAVVGRAVASLAVRGLDADLAEAHLLASTAARLDGDPSAAAEAADAAHVAFTAQHRPGWAALAGHARLLAAEATGDRVSAAALAPSVVAALVRAGWRQATLDARLTAARLALGHGAIEQARHQLEAARGARRQGPAELRARAWHAEALVRLADGDARGADAACRAGLALLARHQASLGANELRVHAASASTELAEIGLGLALRSRRAPRVLAWAERWRAGALRPRPLRPPSDPVLAGHLAELRAVAGQLEEAGFAATPAGGALHRREAALEQAIRQRSWQAPTVAQRRDAGRPPSPGELAAALGERALAELIDHEGQLWAVTLVEGRARLHRLGSSAEVAAEIDALCFALRRLTRTRGPVASRGAAAASARFAGNRLDRLLFEPVAAALGDRSIVLVPTGGMHVVPWSALPSLRGRSLSVVPSAELWLRTATRRAGPAGAGKVLVAGPGLASAEAEIEELAGAYPDATVLEGATATAANVAAALDGAGLAHVAAHGRFRSDNPLFSSLRLADGPLTVHDLEGLRATPRCLVLSACDTGLSTVHPGNELMGMSSAVLGLGSTNVVASVVPVADAVARVVMVDFHRRLRAGALPPKALAEAVEAHPPPDATATGFVCFGA